MCPFFNLSWLTLDISFPPGIPKIHLHSIEKHFNQYFGVLKPLFPLFLLFLRVKYISSTFSVDEHIENFLIYLFRRLYIFDLFYSQFLNFFKSLFQIEFHKFFILLITFVDDYFPYFEETFLEKLPYSKTLYFFIKKLLVIAITIFEKIKTRFFTNNLPKCYTNFNSSKIRLD